MLNKNHIEEYKSIKAPQELKEKVMSLSEAYVIPIETKRNSVIKRVVAAVACAAIIFAGSAAFYNYSGRIEVSNDAGVLSETPVLAYTDGVPDVAVMRGNVCDIISLDVIINETTTVSVDKGEIKIIAADGEESIYAEGFSASEDFSLEWQIPYGVAYAEMTLINDKNTVCIAAERNSDNGQIYLTVK